MRSKTLLYCFSFIVFACANASAQTVENSINLYGNNFPVEKIHIHFDKESYLPGETVWFKAYLFEEDLPSARSTNFYAALYDEQGKMVQQVLCPIFNATTDGHFELPDTLHSKQLICRAYTSWMMNFDSSFYFSKAIRILSTGNDAPKKNTDRTIHFQFFPEGGDIIEGERNSIAFKANYNDGLPFEIDGVLKKQETGEVLMPVKTLHDGMGRFDIQPLPNEKYYAEWTDNNGKLQQTWLPVAKQTGVSLKGVQQKNQFIYNVINRSASDTLYVLGYMYQKVVYKARLSLTNGERYSGLVPLDSFPSGILQLTVFNGAWQPVAERISFVNHNEYALSSSIIYKEVSTQKRAKNVIEINVPDTIPANMSLSITDADISESSSSNIYSNILLSGDLRGYIHKPAYYFSIPADSAQKAELDLVMLTHGWRRYNWDDMRAGKMPQLRYPSDNYLTLYGQVSKLAMDKMQNVLEVNMIIKTKDSSNVFYQDKPDKAGFIREDGIVFYDTARLFFSFNKNRELNNQIAFRASNNTIDQPSTISDHGLYFLPDTTGVSLKPGVSLFNYYLANKAARSLNKDKTLEGVTIKSGGWHNWKNSPLMKMDERYTSGVFSGGANSFSFDVMHDDMAEANYDIYNYLSNRIPGLSYKFSNVLGEGKVFTYHFNKTPVIYIDEHYQENSVLMSLSISDIAYVKLIDHFSNAGEWDATVIAIYLKKGDDLNNRRPSLTDLGKVSIAGYTPIKEFYSPDYSVPGTTTGTDARTTLYWQPYILTNSTHLKVPISFYNNDLTRKFKLVLEGINNSGKMIHIERIIE